jgi:hypothetical protein
MRKPAWIAAVAFAVAPLLLLGGVGGVAPSAHAQGYVRPQTNPFPKPAVSPYLNLLRGGNPAINYYGLVRPQEDTATALLQLQQQQQQQMANQALLAAGDPTLPVTGHPTRFFNYSHYFFNQGGGPAGVLGATGLGGYGFGNNGQLGANAPLTAAFPPRVNGGIGPRSLR